MGNDSPVENEWSPLAPASTAATIGWKKKSKKRSKSPREQALSDKRKRSHPTVSPSVPIVEESSNASNQQESELQVPTGPMNKQGSVTLANEAQVKAGECSDALPDGMTVQWQGSTAILTFINQTLHFCLIGRAKVQVVSGVMEVLGYRLNKDRDAVEIESPTWTSAITLVCLDEHTIVRVDSIRQYGMEQTFRIEDPSRDNIRPTMIPVSWKNAMDRVMDDISSYPCPNDVVAQENQERKDTRQGNCARAVVCGAKHVGKSTCIRYAVHRLLSHPIEAVALLDCDAGQPEMSPPGMLTLTLIEKPLLSPPHHHMVMGEASLVTQEHVDAYFYGHVTSKADPSLFLQCITKLLQSYVLLIEERYGGDESKLPLLVNTDGWIKGMGFEILSAMLDTIRPNHVIQLLGEARSKVFDLTDMIKDKQMTLHEAHSYRNSNVAHDSIEVAPVAAIQSSMYRSLRLCTYFLGSTEIWDRVEFGQYGIGDYECEIGLSLASLKPYVVPMDSIQYETIRGVDVPCDLWSEDVVLDALNGSIVGLCCRQVRKGNNVAIADSETTTVACLPCVGLGLIRSIDRERRCFFILTPVPLETLQNADVFVGGSIHVPTECVYRGVHSEVFPYMSCDGVSVGVGGEFMKSRNTLMRRASSL